MPRTRLVSGLLAFVLLAAAALAGCGSDGKPVAAGSPEDRLEAIARRVLDGDIASARPQELTYWRISGPTDSSP